MIDSLQRNDRDSCSPQELRRYPRHALRNPLLGIPILADGSPDWEHRRTGCSVNLSMGGMGLEFDCEENLEAREMVVVVQGANRPLGCAGLEIRHARRGASGRLEVGGQFGGLANEILRQENLVPAFHASTLEFGLGLPVELLER